MCPTPYQTISKTFNKRNPNVISIIQTGDWKFASGDYISPVTRQKASPVVGLMTWMTAEMKSTMMRAIAPLRKGSSTHTILHVAVESGSENKGSSHKCRICKTQAHWTDECQKFLALHREDHINLMQENHACFSCQKRAGRYHKITTFSRRKQCTEIENSIQCKQYHHPLLHKNVPNVRASISSMTEN